EEIELVHCPENSMATDLFAKADYFASHLDEDAFKHVLKSLLTELFYYLKISGNEFFIDSSNLSPNLSKAIDYISDNLFTLSGVKEIANSLYVSEQYLYRIFQNQIKTSPKKYINTRRLLFAQSMLRQGARPTDVFEKCGFNSYPGFYKQYVATFGYSPSKEHPIETLR
ncbi:MAG: helix-turn-helix domain-containing protein, partial [Candidatus Scatosoma sp.]